MQVKVQVPEQWKQQLEQNWRHYHHYFLLCWAADWAARAQASLDVQPTVAAQSRKECKARTRRHAHTHPHARTHAQAHAHTSGHSKLLVSWEYRAILNPTFSTLCAQYTTYRTTHPAPGTLTRWKSRKIPHTLQHTSHSMCQANLEQHHYLCKVAS